MFDFYTKPEHIPCSLCVNLPDCTGDCKKSSRLPPPDYHQVKYGEHVNEFNTIL